MDIEVSNEQRTAFANALRRLNAAGIPYVVAGAFCVHYYTGIWRNTKDMDIFALPDSVPGALRELAEAGFKTWIEAEHWLGKATTEHCMVDVIFGSGNWLAPVDAVWFDRSRPSTLFGEPVRMAPLEEMIWAKSYIAGRERYDGADVCHLIRAASGKLDWRHVLWRYDRHWELLLTYLTLYRFIYPSDQQDIPGWVLDDLLDRLSRERRQTGPRAKVCRGTLLDRFSYNYDVEHLGYRDARDSYTKPEDVVGERAWAREKLARGEVYKHED